MVHAAARCRQAGSKSRAVRAHDMSVARALGVLQAVGGARQQMRCMPHASGSAAHQLSGLRARYYRRPAGPCADRQAVQAAGRPFRGGHGDTPRGPRPAACRRWGAWALYPNPNPMLHPLHAGRTSSSMAEMRCVDSSSSRLMCMWNGICRRRSSFSCSGVLSWYLRARGVP